MLAPPAASIFGATTRIFGAPADAIHVGRSLRCASADRIVCVAEALSTAHRWRADRHGVRRIWLATTPDELRLAPASAPAGNRQSRPTR